MTYTISPGTHRATSLVATGENLNCTCPVAVIVSVLGVERCQNCGKVAGRDAFVPLGHALPSRRRRIVEAA